MIELFLKLMDKLIELATKRQEDRRQLFVDVVQPMYAALDKVVEEYFSLLWDGKKTVNQGINRTELRKTLDAMREKHQNIVRARTKVMALADAIRTQVPHKGIIALCEKIASLFASTEIVAEGSQSAGRRMIADFELLEKNEITLAQINRYLDQVLSQLQDRWASVAQSYATLQVLYLKH